MRSSTGRACLFVGGVVICAWCYLFVTATSMGSGPLFVLEEGISHVTGVPFGVVTLATGLFLLALAAVLRAPVGPGTLFVPALFGLAVSVFEPFTPTVTGTVARVALFLVATHVMMLGAAMVVCASFGASAVDAVMIGLARLSRRSQARVRIVMEVLLAAVGIALGGRAGLGTAVAALTVGHSFDFWARLLPSPVAVPTRDRLPRRRGAERPPAGMVG